MMEPTIRARTTSTIPRKKATMNATVVVITVAFIVAFFLGIVDIVLARIVGSIMK